MTLTAHVPAGINRAGKQVAPAIAELGTHLADLGIALQQEESTIGQLTRLAEACGVDLCIKMKVRPKAPQGDNVAQVEEE